MMVAEDIMFRFRDFSELELIRYEHFRETGGRYVVFEETAPKGRPPFSVPDDLTILDLRYGGTTLLRGNHPRIEGLWTQYSHLETGLQKDFTISTVIHPETPICNWRSEEHKIQMAPVGALTSEDYRHQHNHYQSLHAEVYNFAPDLNGVAIWGDSAALAPNAKSWGGFFSTRSWPLRWTEYTPKCVGDYNNEDFDAALVGVEIDVLNAGLDWDKKAPLSESTLSKIGLQIVGFGNKNTAAIEIRSEDSDDGSRGPEARRGTWNWGVIIRGSLNCESTVIKAENGLIRRGIDFDDTTFREGAFRITGVGSGSGIVFDSGAGGEIYSEPVSDGGHQTVIKLGSGGLRIMDSTGQHVLMSITDEGVRIVKSADS
jgi:hypothetical protein